MRNTLKQLVFSLGIVSFGVVQFVEAVDQAAVPTSRRPKSLSTPTFPELAPYQIGSWTPKPAVPGEGFGRHRISSLDEGESKGTEEVPVGIKSVVLSPAEIVVGSELLESAQSLSRDGGSYAESDVVASPAKLTVDQDPYAKLKKELIIERMGDDGWRYPLTRAERATVLSKLHLIPGIEEFLRPNRFARDVSKVLILNIRTNGQLKDLSKVLDDPAKGYSIHLNYIYVGDDLAKQNVMITDRTSQILFDINGGILE